MFGLIFCDSGLDYGNITYVPEITRLEKLTSPEKWMSIKNGPSDIFSMGLSTLFRIKPHCYLFVYYKTYDLPVCMIINAKWCQIVTIRSFEQ